MEDVELDVAGDDIETGLVGLGCGVAVDASCVCAPTGTPSRLARGVASVLPMPCDGDCGMGERLCSFRFAPLVTPPESGATGVELPGDRMPDDTSEAERGCDVVVVPAGVRPH